MYPSAVTAMYIAQPLDTFFTTFGILATGAFLGFIVVAVFVGTTGSEEDEVTSFERKYYDEFTEMEVQEHTDEFLKGLSNVYINETTPSNGEVIMSYDHDTECWHYWCDDKNIKYLTLEAVAHKYTIDNNCKAVCVDYKDELDKAIEKVREQKRTNKELAEAEAKDESKESLPDDDKPKDVFAKFKSYNTVNKDTASDKTMFSLVPDKSNRYKRRGPVSEWPGNQKTEREENVGLEEEKPKMSVAEFLRKRKRSRSEETPEGATPE
jgi:hypothetical protein